MIEHHGVVQRIEHGLAIVAMQTGGCSSCGQGGSCGIGRLAEGRPSTLLTVPACAGIQAGDPVTIGLPSARLTLSALFGYLFPAVAMLLGAWLGSVLAGSDSGTALGAIAGFVLALLIVRLAIAVLPDLLPSPRLIQPDQPSQISHQEQHHDRNRDRRSHPGN